MAAYRAKRFMDKFRPGDEIPDGTYDEDHIKRMLTLKMIEPIAEAETKPAAKPAASKAKK